MGWVGGIVVGGLRKASPPLHSHPRICSASIQQDFKPWCMMGWVLYRGYDGLI